MNLPTSHVEFPSFMVEPPVRPTKNQMMALVERPITDWIEAVDDIDRINESLSITERYFKKVKDDKPKTKTDSPLSSLKFLARAMKLGDRLTVTGAIKANRRVKRSFKKKAKS